MRKGQRRSNSSESEENQRSSTKDSRDQLSSYGCSSGEVSWSDSAVKAQCAMKRSKRFTSSFSFDEEDRPQTTDEKREEVSPKNSNGVSATVAADADLAAESAQFRKRDTFCEAIKASRSVLFRPQELWLAVRRCISLRWPPCISRQSSAKLSYQVDMDQSEDTLSSVSSESANDSSSLTSTSDDRDVIVIRNEGAEVKTKAVKSCALPCRGISRSSPRLPRARQATDLVLASMILERETFLRIELVDSGDVREDVRYRAEWKLSERTEELAEGVWISRDRKPTH